MRDKTTGEVHPMSFVVTRAQVENFNAGIGTLEMSLGGESMTMRTANGACS